MSSNEPAPQVPPATTKRGGARPGSGRPKSTGAGLALRRQVTLDDATVATLRWLGNGNISEGIRIAASLAEKATGR